MKSIPIRQTLRADGTASMSLRWVPFPRPVTLMAIKDEPGLANMALVKNSRLSVQPVTDEEWALVCRMGGYKA